MVRQSMEHTWKHNQEPSISTLLRLMKIIEFEPENASRSVFRFLKDCHNDTATTTLPAFYFKRDLRSCINSLDLFLGRCFCLLHTMSDARGDERRYNEKKKKNNMTSVNEAESDFSVKITWGKPVFIGSG